MISSKVVSRVLIPCATVIVESKKNAQKEKICKPSELPIYTPDKPTVSQQEAECFPEPGAIENTFATIRRTIFTFTTEVNAYQRVATEYVEKGIDNADWLIKYLGQEDNTTPKVGAIAIGGLTGLILGLRGGFFKRTLYASIGATAMAAVCYPKEASEYSEIGFQEAKKYLTIAYNFAYGVKKDDPPLELPTIKVPGSLSEAWELASNFGKSVAGPQEEPKK